jgi:uncharacterized protein involved in exopolysaccharide biosynthesis/protein involved in polysaccharide export with SLBB domain
LPVDHTPPNDRSNSSSLRSLIDLVKRRRIFILSVVGGLLFLCLLYCLIAPNQYEASAKVAMRVQSGSSLNLESAESFAQASILSAPLQLETLANIFRSDRLAWRVITELRLDQQPAFSGNFSSKFPDFKPDTPTPEARQYLIERFEKKLTVQALPRTLLLSIRFRTKDAALSAKIVNALVADFIQQESESRIEATTQASQWLIGQLKDLKTRVESDQQKLANFQRDHGLLGKSETTPDGQESITVRNPILLEVEDLGHQLALATSERILDEALYRSAQQGNPELVLSGNSQIQIASGLSTEMFVQLHNRRSDLEQEQAKLSAEYGPTYPRVVEIQHQIADVDAQIKSENARLIDRFHSAWQTAQDRESLIRTQLEDRTRAGLAQNQATTEYALMQLEARSSGELLAHVKSRLEEGGLAAGIHSSSITLIDPAYEPYKPVSPDLPLYLAITFFVSLWLALGGALLLDSLESSSSKSGSSNAQSLSAILFCATALSLAAHINAQAPTPSTQGIPAGVTQPILPPKDQRTLPNPKEAPAIWNSPLSTATQNSNEGSGQALEAPLAAPLSPGDVIDVSEFHTPEFHTVTHVAPDGTISLPLLRSVQVVGLNEQAAARAIEKALIDAGVLFHPQVSVLVTVYAGQDVSVLGEVARPGVYAFTVHHRLLDLISSAQGLSPSAGRLVNVFHRNDPQTPHPFALDPSGADTKQDHNPELEPGDTVQVSRAGLVYVIGDVVRPGGFPVDPVQGLTVVQAVSLAWGPTPNSSSKALLIREQKGGRTLTTLNLHRMLHGLEPDLPIHDRDILFVPDSTTKGMLNRTIEAAIQSAVGVSIYAGLVYSQRF